MRIKLYENFLNENNAPEMLNSFEEAEGKLSGKDGIVLSITGDMSDVDNEIKDIPHTEAYVLITDQSSHVASSWKSDVFLVGGKKEGEKTISDYFKANENMNEASGKYPLLDEVVKNLSDQVAQLINEKSEEIKGDSDNAELLKKMPYVAQYILEEVIKNLEKRV